MGMITGGHPPKQRLHLPGCDPRLRLSAQKKLVRRNTQNLTDPADRLYGGTHSAPFQIRCKLAGDANGLCKFVPRHPMGLPCRPDAAADFDIFWFIHSASCPPLPHSVMSRISKVYLLSQSALHSNYIVHYTQFCYTQCSSGGRFDCRMNLRSVPKLRFGSSGKP